MDYAEARIRILTFLASQDQGPADSPSASEIAWACEEQGEWAFAPLRRLERHRLVEKAGLSLNNAQTWRITDAGRAILASERADQGAPAQPTGTLSRRERSCEALWIAP